MKVMTCTLYQEHFELWVETHESIAVNSCQIELARKHNINTRYIQIYTQTLSSRTGVEGRHIQFKIWDASQIKDLKLVIPEHYIFMTSNSFLIVFSILGNILKRLHVTSHLQLLTHTK